MTYLEFVTGPGGLCVALCELVRQGYLIISTRRIDSGQWLVSCRTPHPSLVETGGSRD
jgi:hypothetical protein